MIYGLFLVFIGVQIFEGILMNHLPTKVEAHWGWDPIVDEFLMFNYGIVAIFDAVFRIMIAAGVLYMTKGKINDTFKDIDTSLAIKTFFVRLMIQVGECCGTVAAVFLAASTYQVISQVRIPLVGILAFIILCRCFTRDQIIYVIAILPLAIQFNLLGAIDAEQKKKATIGYIAAALGLLLLASSNVLVEKLLKQEYAKLEVWNKQLLMSLFDLPVMIMIYVAFVVFERYILGIMDRVWNPFDKSNFGGMNAMWVIVIGMNGALWGFSRLCILQYQDAMWLNLAQVSVMGFIWLEECIEEWTGITEIAEGGKPTFTWPKLLCLLSLTVILVGYELANQEDKEIKEEGDWITPLEDLETGDGDGKKQSCF